MAARTTMLDRAPMKSVAEQRMSGQEVDGQAVDGPAAKLRERRTGSGRLRTVRFPMNGPEYQAIEQNPEKPSRWGQLARTGRTVAQFKDAVKHRYVGVAVGGEVKEYGRLP